MGLFGGVVGKLEASAVVDLLENLANLVVGRLFPTSKHILADVEAAYGAATGDNPPGVGDTVLDSFTNAKGQAYSLVLRRTS